MYLTKFQKGRNKHSRRRFVGSLGMRRIKRSVFNTRTDRK